MQLAKEGMMACLFCVGQRLLYGKLKISGRPMLVEVDEKCIARVRYFKLSFRAMEF